MQHGKKVTLWDAGAGVQAQIAASNGAGTSPVRFGSPEFAAEVLPAAQGAALAKAAAAVGRENAVSVLVRAAPGRPDDDYGEDAVVRLFAFQARATSGLRPPTVGTAPCRLYRRCHCLDASLPVPGSCIRLWQGRICVRSVAT